MDMYGSTNYKSIDMKKEEFINRYGIEKYQRQLEKTKEWDRNHRKTERRWFKDDKEKRATILLRNYMALDKKYDRGECSLTKEDIYKLWEQGCHWCGETDWHSLGADRLDNSKPHTKENCVCSCRNCNVKRGRTIKVFQYTSEGKFIREWESANEVNRCLGFNSSSISECCRGKRYKTVGGYIWKYKKINNLQN